MEGVDLRLEEGTVTALLGPNGGGKSSLLLALSGALSLASGEVRVEGEGTSGWSPRSWARRVALCPQATVFDAPFPVMEAVVMGRYALREGLSGYDGTDRRIAREVLGELGLEGFEERPVTDLSGGEAARVALARALVREAPVLLLDEPTAALDPRQTLRVAELLRNRAGRGVAVLAAFHDVNLALASADRLVFLREGRLAGETEPRRPDLDLMESVYGVPWELARTKGGTSVAVPRPGPVIPTAGRGR